MTLGLQSIFQSVPDPAQGEPALVLPRGTVLAQVHGGGEVRVSLVTVDGDGSHVQEQGGGVQLLILGA